VCFLESWSELDDVERWVFEQSESFSCCIKFQCFAKKVGIKCHCAYFTWIITRFYCIFRYNKRTFVRRRESKYWCFALEWHCECCIITLMVAVRGICAGFSHWVSLNSLVLGFTASIHWKRHSLIVV